MNDAIEAVREIIGPIGSRHVSAWAGSLFPIVPVKTASKMLWSQSPCPSPVLPPSCVALFGDSLTCQSTCQQSRVAVGQNHLALKFDFILWIPSFDRPRPTGQMLKQRGHQRTVNVAVIAAPPSLVPLLPPPCITKRPHVGRSVAAPLPESSSGTTVDRTKEEIQRRSRPRARCPVCAPL